MGRHGSIGGKGLDADRLMSEFDSDRRIDNFQINHRYGSDDTYGGSPTTSSDSSSKTPGAPEHHPNRLSSRARKARNQAAKTAKKTGKHKGNKS